MIKNGIDLIEIDRVAKSIESPAFLRYVYGPRETAELQARGGQAEHFAGAFAAKEAFSKALGTGLHGFSLSEVELLHDEHGAPYLALSGNALALAETQNLEFAVSITHTKTYAAAMVTAYTKGM